jgi:hypothetical protein
MKRNIVVITVAMLVCVALAESYDAAFAQNSGPPPQYQNGPPPQQYRDSPGPGERFEEMYRRGYRAGYMAARHNDRYDDRVPDPRDEHPDDRYGYHPDRPNNDGPQH